MECLASEGWENRRGKNKNREWLVWKRMNSQVWDNWHFANEKFNVWFSNFAKRFCIFEFEYIWLSPSVFSFFILGVAQPARGINLWSDWQLHSRFVSFRLLCCSSHNYGYRWLTTWSFTMAHMHSLIIFHWILSFKRLSFSVRKFILGSYYLLWV